jgi:hypothetical protein
MFPLLLTDFHFADTIFRACGWMMGLKTRWACLWSQIFVGHANRNVSPMPFQNCFPSHLAWPFRCEPLHVPAIPMYIIVVIGVMASAFAHPETNRRSVLAIVLECGYWIVYLSREQEVFF